MSKVEGSHSIEDMFKQRAWYSQEAWDIISDESKMTTARSIMGWLQKYMPKHFPKPAPSLHIEMLAIAFYAKNSALCVPRAHSKSTLLTFGLAMYRIVFMQKKYVVVASESLDKAELFVVRIRDELEYNAELVKDHYPDGYKSTDWAKGAIITKTRIKVQAVGYGQSGRGLIFEDSRPDWVIYDDLETSENAGDQNMKDKFLSDLYPAIARSNPNSQRTYVGTIINKESLLYETVTDIDIWTSVKYEAIRDDGSMLAPMLYSKEDYDKDKKSYNRKNKLSIFYAENHNNPFIQDEDAVFLKDNFRYYDEDMEFSKMNTMIFYDPAMPISGRTRAKNVDRSCIMVISINYEGHWFIREIYANRDTPSKNRDLLFKLNTKYRKEDFRVKTYMETISAQRAMFLEIKEDMKRRDEVFKLEEIPSHKGSKEARIEQLEPLYIENMIWHKKSDKSTSMLEEELLLFGNTSHDDISDTLSFALGRLKKPRKPHTIESKKERDFYQNVFENNTDLGSWKII